MFEVREKPKMVERAYLVGLEDGGTGNEEAQLLLGELAELVNTLGIGVIGKEIAKVRERQARLLLGSGKVAAIIENARKLEADCLVIDAELSPAQQRNWETESGLCVIDRQEVILDIFNERAQTKEAVLQVSLARAEHSLPRLKNAWTHLSRQRGGGGVTQRGEGEAQIELDARMVRQRIAKLKKELEVVVKQRGTQRKQRQRVPIPTAAIVGYTNAGKSTLLNKMTGANVLSEDKLFATLDPTTRQIRLKSGHKLLLTDTVGFVRKLPHKLVDAFRATLEESVLADFLIHVVDVSNPEFMAQYETTLSVLKELGADQKRLITVFNKMDLLEDSGRLSGMNRHAIPVSAQTGEGLNLLEVECEKMLEDQMESRVLMFPHNRYDLINKLHNFGAIKEEKPDEAGVRVVANIPLRMMNIFDPFVVSNI